MNDILLNVLSVVVTAVVVPLISYLGFRLSQWLSTKIKDEKAKVLLTNAINVVTDAVRATFQTYVEALKKSGTFDKDAQIKAFTLAKDTVLKQLSDESVQFISSNYGDIDNWLTTQIESAINQLKN